MAIAPTGVKSTDTTNICPIVNSATRLASQFARTVGRKCTLSREQYGVPELTR